MATRKPLSFSMDTAEPVPQAVPALAPAPVSPPRTARAKSAPRDSEERKQVGARIRARSYRQLKARAALEGRLVQDLVELAVEEYLANHQETDTGRR